MGQNAHSGVLEQGPGYQPAREYFGFPSVCVCHMDGSGLSSFRAPAPPKQAPPKSSSAGGREPTHGSGVYQDTMFEQTLLRSKDGKRQGEAFLASLAAQILLGGVLIVVPLFYTQALPAFELDSLPLPPPVLRKPAPQPEAARPKPTQRAPTSTVREFIPVAINVPRQVPTSLPTTQHFAEPVPSIAVGPATVGDPGPALGTIPGGSPGIGACDRSTSRRPNRLSNLPPDR